MALQELEAIERFFRPLAGEGAFGLFDDAARIVPPPGRDLVVTSDTIAEGVHFLPGDPPGSIAQKALRVNLSDLAAKGADPLGYLLNVALPPALDDEWLAHFCMGLAADQAEFRIDLLGGDTIAMPHGLLISISAFGTVPAGGMVHRFGGTPGDALYVSGVIGSARLGLALLTGDSGPWESLDAAARERLIDRYRLPQPRLGLAPALLAHASAAMDVSDGLVGDCDKMAAACGCSALLAAEAVPVDAALHEAVRDDGLLAELISGGDDYEVLAAVPPAAEAEFAAAAAAAGIAVRRIGHLTEGTGPAEVRRDGRPFAVGKRAFVHGTQGREA